MKNKNITPAKANMRAMAKNGGLAGFKNGGGAYDGLMKAQDGNKETELSPFRENALRIINKIKNVKGVKYNIEARRAAAKEEALLKAAKAKQRNPKPGPNEY